MTPEDAFMMGLAIFFAIPVVMAGWSVTIDWYLFDREQKAQVEREWDEWVEHMGVGEP